MLCCGPLEVEIQLCSTLLTPSDKSDKWMIVLGKEGILTTEILRCDVVESRVQDERNGTFEWMLQVHHSINTGKL